MWSSRLLLRLALVYIAIQALLWLTMLLVLDRWNAEGARVIAQDANAASQWFEIHRASSWYFGATLLGQTWSLDLLYGFDLGIDCAGSRFSSSQSHAAVE